MKNESKKANAKLTSVLAAVLIIVVAIVAVIAVKTKDSGSLGTYSCEIMSGDNSSTVFEITFNEKNNTYKENISVGDKAVELASGTFVMDGNKLTLTSDGGDVQNLVKQGKYLIAKDYLYEGEIPDGDLLMLPVHLRIVIMWYIPLPLKRMELMYRMIMVMYRKELIRVTETGLNVRAVLAQA